MIRYSKSVCDPISATCRLCDRFDLVRSLQSAGNFAVIIVNSVKFASRQYCSSGNFGIFSLYVLYSELNN